MECHDLLVTGLEATVDSFSTKCYSGHLISEDALKDVTELNIPNRKKATRVLCNVKRTIEQKHEMFEKFLSVLKELTCCDHLVEKLERKKALLCEVCSTMQHSLNNKGVF